MIELRDHDAAIVVIAMAEIRNRRHFLRRATPLVSREVVVELIRATTTQSGLRVRAKLDIHPNP